MKKLLFTVLFLLSAAGIAQAKKASWEMASGKCFVSVSAKVSDAGAAILEDSREGIVKKVWFSSFNHPGTILEEKGKTYAGQDPGLVIKYRPEKLKWTYRLTGRKARGKGEFSVTIAIGDGSSYETTEDFKVTANGIMESDPELDIPLTMTFSSQHAEFADYKLSLEPCGKTLVCKETRDGIKFTVDYSPRTRILKMTAKGGTFLKAIMGE